MHTSAHQHGRTSLCLCVCLCVCVCVCIQKKVQESAAINGPALPHEGRGPRPILCQMVVPETTISAVIGRGGEKLKALQARTQAKVHVANKGSVDRRGEKRMERKVTCVRVVLCCAVSPALGGPSAVALSERIISVNGPQDAVYEAIAHIAESIQVSVDALHHTDHTM